MKHRIEYLDGHRGVAILMVILFHAYSRWFDVVPYGTQFDWPVFRLGRFGVQLFFLVSGFVILMTLEKCLDAREFMYRRWIRLFPAMLLCSAFIFLTAPVFWERPNGAPSLLSVVPGLTFLDSAWWSAWTGVSIKPLEGDFWSIYVEFKFYAFAAITYFIGGRWFFLGMTAAVFFIVHMAAYVAVHFAGLPLAAGISEWFRLLSFDYFGWFVAGALFYVYATQNNRYCLIGGMVMALAASLLQGKQGVSVIAMLLVSALFLASLLSSKIQALLTWRGFQFMGYVSYPLYLLHENIMIALVVKLGRLDPGIPSFFYPWLAIVPIIGMAYLIARKGEPAVKNLIESVLRVEKRRQAKMAG